MTKNLYKFFIVMVAVIFYAAPSFSSLDIPHNVTTVVTDVEAGIKNAESQVTAVKTKIEQVITTAKEKYEMAKKKLMDKVAKVLGGSKEEKAKPIATMKTVKESKILSAEKQKDPKEISKVVQQLFMAYPSEDHLIMTAYRRKAEEFWMDTLMELNVVAHSFDEEIADLEKAVEELAEAENLASGGSSSSSSEEDTDYTEAYKSAYEAYSTFNDLAKIAETLATLRAQYKAARYIRYYVTPVPYKGEKESSLMINSTKLAARDIKTFDIGFAAMEVKKQTAEMMPFRASETAIKSEMTKDVKQAESFKNSEINSLQGKQTLPVKNVVINSKKENKPLPVKNVVINSKKENKPLPVKNVVINSPKTIGAENSLSFDDMPMLATEKKLSPSTVDKIAKEVQKVDNSKAVNDLEPFGGYVFDPAAHATLEFKKSASPDLQSSFSGTEAEFELMNKMQEAYDIMTKALNMHNIRQGLKGYKNSFDAYHDIVNQHILAINNVIKSDACVINFLSNYYKNPKRVWYGSKEVTNPIDYEGRGGISGWAYKSFVAGKVLVSEGEGFISEDGKTKGFDAMDYDVGDDDGVDVDSTATNAKDAYSEKYGEKDDSKEGSEDEDEDNDTGTVPGLANQTDAAKIKQDVRLKEKFNFLIGSEVAQALAADQYGKQQWGTPYRKFKIWNDQKSFYDVYLEKKYANMEDYLDELSYLDFLMEMVKTVRQKYVNEDENIQKAVQSELSRTYNTYKSKKEEIVANLDSKNKLKQLIEERKNMLNSMRNNYEKEKAQIEKDLNKKLAEIDELFAMINEKQDEIDSLKKIINEAKAEEKQASTEEVEGHDRMLKAKGKQSGFLNNAIRTKLEKIKIQVDTKIKLNAAKSKMQAYRSQQKALEKNIQSKKKALIERSEKYEKEFLDKEKFYENQINAARENKFQNSTLYTTMNVYENYVKGSNSIVKSQLEYIDGGVLQCIKAYAKEQVRKTKEDKIDKLGDEKYSLAGGEKIAQYHKEMMKAFQPSEDDLRLFEECAKIPGEQSFFIAGIAEMFKNALYNKICNEDKCLTEDEEYFVGVAPSERDFVSAHPMSEGVLPPMREIIYFDNEDFTSIPKKNKLIGLKIYKKVNREEAAKVITNEKKKPNGRIVRVPEIWEKMLDPHSYVEVGYDLENLALDGDNEKNAANNYVRSGIYPCEILNGIYLDIKTDAGDKNYFLISTQKPKAPYDINLPECQEMGAIYVPEPKQWFDYSKARMVQNYDIKLESNGKAYRLYDKVYDKADWSRRDGLMEGTLSEGETDMSAGASELGSILSYYKPQESASNPTTMMPVRPPRVKDGIMVVAPTPSHIFKRMKKEDEDDKKGKTTMYSAINYRTQMKRNQFGDFLSMVENEQTLSQAESELREEVNILRQKLISGLSTAGIEVNGDIDLSDEKQYEDLSTRLLVAKTKLLGDMSSKMAELTYQNNKENELLDEKMKKMSAVLSALVKDKDTMVVISDDSDGNSPEFMQKIIEAEVNKKASDKYESDVKENTGGMIEPYCASYPVY